VTAATIVRLGDVGSTMDALHALAEGGAVAGTAVVARSQTAGRGSRGRPWASPPGGLWLSVLSRPAAAGLELVSLRTGLRVAETLEGLGAGDRIRLKWPNDLMLDERKLGGILCEARWQGPELAWVVIGLGLNVENQPPPELTSGAARLREVLPGITVETLVRPIVSAVREVDAAAGPLTDPEQARFAARDWLRGRRILAPLAGTPAGVADDGALLVCRADGTTAAVRAGTIVLAEPAAPASTRSAT
jgi:BirA family transcriptional regulator, biotin operon repressor / biotin---[acetyl-CoA-carboxylase] ligase